MNTAVTGNHEYLSTACMHDLHDRCIQQCKWCDTPNRCVCACHNNTGHIPVSATSRAVAEVRAQRIADIQTGGSHVGFMTPMLASMTRAELIREAAVIVAAIETRSD